MGTRNLGCLSACARPVISPGVRVLQRLGRCARGGWWLLAYATAGRVPVQRTQQNEERTETTNTKYQDILKTISKRIFYSKKAQ